MESLIDPSVLLGLAWPESLAWVKNFAMVAIGLGFVIFVHELGHFLVAKACGVQCDKFYVGFDVPIPLGFFTIPGKLVHFKWGETEYGIGAIPLGGYVKMLGQDDNPNNAEAEVERTHVRDEAGNVKLNPRSYMAKSVPQRMAIISAGVIMNLIFGFIFAAIAYGYGVMIQPAVIGATSPGDPAWRENLKSGDRILQVGKQGEPNQHMRFQKDMMLNLALYGKFDTEYDILIEHADGQQQWVSMVPSDRHRKVKTGIARPTLGITPSLIPVFGKVEKPKLPFLGTDLVEKVTVDGAEQLATKFKSGDKIVAIDGEPVQNYGDLQRLLAARPDKAIVLTIERAAKKEGATESQSAQASEQYTLELSPLPARDYGVQMEMTPIIGVQKDSPAEEAGFKVGDKLVSFNGEEIGDPLEFPQRTLEHVGKTVDVTVERSAGGKSEQVTLPVTLRSPPQRGWASMTPAVAVESMGIAYEVTSRVAAVDENGPAKGKLQPGDEITAVKFVAAGKEQKTIEGAAFKHPEEAIEIDGRMLGWPFIVLHATTSRLPDTTLVATVKREGEQEPVSVELQSVASTETFLDDRGLSAGLQELEELHQANSAGEAMALGYREMSERISEVGAVLVGLVTGKLSLFQMGGIPSILGAASAEAERGVADLLMFFAFLSANLAVLNFLPIPVLDGGHMLFLLYEGIRRKPVNPEVQLRLTYAGLLFLLALMLFVNLHDLWRYFV